MPRFAPAGMGEAAASSTPMMTPDRSVSDPAVPLTLTDPLVDSLHAEVRTASQVWSTPLLARHRLRAAQPEGVNACVAAVLSPQTHGDEERGGGGAPRVEVQARSRGRVVGVDAGHGVPRAEAATSTTRQAIPAMAPLGAT